VNVDLYLKRINYDGSLQATTETLRALQWAHLKAVPFENLSIHINEPIVLNDEGLYDKIVRCRRGGFCYEANGLFSWLLSELGFHVQKLSAGVANSKGVFGPEFDHMTLVVSLAERWLADVGFGDSFRYPLLLDERGEQHQGRRSYRIVDNKDSLLLLQRENSNEWTPQYRFNLAPHDFSDYQGMCEYHQSSPESHFTQNIICSKATDEGRVTISGNRLIVTSADGTRNESTLSGVEELLQVLRDTFGIHLPEGDRLKSSKPLVAFSRKFKKKL